MSEPLNADLDREGFRQLFDKAPDGVVIVNAEGKIVLVNQQIERLFGFDRDDLIGREIEALIPKRFHGSHVGQRTAFARSPEIRPMGSGLELWGCRKNGSEFPVEISLSPVSTARGAFVSASIRDVTKRRALQAETKRLQQYLLSAIDSIEGSFFIWDAGDRLVMCNSEARALWTDGLEGGLIGYTWLEVVEANVKAGVLDLDDESASAFQQRLVSYHRDPVWGIQLQNSVRTIAEAGRASHSRMGHRGARHRCHRRRQSRGAAARGPRGSRGREFGKERVSFVDEPRAGDRSCTSP